MSLDDIDIDSWDKPTKGNTPEKEPDQPEVQEPPRKPKRDANQQRQPRAPRQHSVDPESLIHRAMDAFNEIKDEELAAAILATNSSMAGCKTVKGIVKRNGSKSLDGSSLRFITNVVKQLFQAHLEKRMKGKEDE